MKTEVVSPHLGNFVNSIRDIGYSTEVAVADILDNCIAAKAKNVKIHAVAHPKLIFSILDDGTGMSTAELVEAMRLATKNPESKRDKSDLGRFGLGLKTASFSQCKLLTVVSKKDGVVSAKQWDLELLAKKNQWLLVTPGIAEIKKYPLYIELDQQKQGTLVVWQQIDGFDKDSIADLIDQLRKHLLLVFHRFMEGIKGIPKLTISINNNPISPFDPFNLNHPATQKCRARK